MSYYFSLAILLFFYMNLWFIVSLIKKRNDVADTAWGLGFVMLAWTSLFLGGIFSIKSVLLCLLISIWGLRLAWHIHRRHQNKPEDPRYALWRATWGKWFYLRSYLQIYILQGFLLFLIALPFLIINQAIDPELKIWDTFGIALWLFGFYFEATSDWQLRNFNKIPANKGKILQKGLWAHSRHPNYFGEVTQWWGIFMISSVSADFFPAIISPLTITVLILFISGIPLLEKKYAGNPDFEAYKKKTPAFFPLGFFVNFFKK